MKEKPSCNSNTPNKNMMIIERIQGLMSEVNVLVSELEPLSATAKVTCEKRTMRSQALDEINLFQTTTQHELRKAFE